jgi:hypothetical protein
MESVKMEILGVKWQNWRKRSTGLTPEEKAGKLRNTGVSSGANARAKRSEKSSL